MGPAEVIHHWVVHVSFTGNVVCIIYVVQKITVSVSFASKNVHGRNLNHRLSLNQNQKLIIAAQQFNKIIVHSLIRQEQINPRVV